MLDMEIYLSNQSGWIPVGHRLLVLPDQVEEKTSSGIILNTQADQRREEMAQIYGTVVAMGSTCYSDQVEPWCKVGDTVIFAKYGGLLLDGIDGKKYRWIDDLNIVGVRE